MSVFFKWQKLHQVYALPLEINELCREMVIHMKGNYSDFPGSSSTVDSRYLELQGTLWNTSRYPYLDISDLQNWGNNNSINHI